MHENCSKSAQGASTFCISHGGGRRCQHDGCMKRALSFNGYCRFHNSGASQTTQRLRVVGRNSYAPEAIDDALYGAEDMSEITEMVGVTSSITSDITSDEDLFDQVVTQTDSIAHTHSPFCTTPCFVKSLYEWEVHSNIDCGTIPSLFSVSKLGSNGLLPSPSCMSPWCSPPKLALSSVQAHDLCSASGELVQPKFLPACDIIVPDGRTQRSMHQWEARAVCVQGVPLQPPREIERMLQLSQDSNEETLDRQQQPRRLDKFRPPLLAVESLQTGHKPRVLNFSRALLSQHQPPTCVV